MSRPSPKLCDADRQGLCANTAAAHHREWLMRCKDWRLLAATLWQETEITLILRRGSKQTSPTTQSSSVLPLSLIHLHAHRLPQELCGP